MGTQGKTVFKDTVEKYWQNFIFMHKNTPAHEGNDAPTTSYMTGLWLADYAYQWGGLMDTWKWYETGKWKLFEESSIGKSQGNRQWLTQPEAMLGAEALNIYLNGGTVYNFEHPAYTYGVKNEETPLFSNVIETLFKYIIRYPAPSKEQVLSNTKVFLRGNYSSKRDGYFFVNVNTATNQSPLYTTGRYGTIPAVPSSISLETLRQKLPESIQLVSMYSNEMNSTDNRKKFLDNLYPEEYTGKIFGDEMDNRVFIYNYEYNRDVDQTGSFELNGKEFEVTLKSHSFTIVEEVESGLHVILNNYRINKDSLWQEANDSNSAKKLPQLSKPEAIDWVYNNYIHNTPKSEQRTTQYVIKNVNRLPKISVIESTDKEYKEPIVEFDEAKKIANIAFTTNGFTEFLIHY